MMPIMPKPRLYAEELFIRVPEGTKALIEALRGSERQGDFLRRILIDTLNGLNTNSAPLPDTDPLPPQT